MPLGEVMSKTVDIGQVAYEGYCTVSDGKSLVSGAPLPTWEEQAPEIREAWRAAADAVLMFASVRPQPIRFKTPEVTVESNATAADRLDVEGYRATRRGDR
jgi:hypothetical protein